MWFFKKREKQNIIKLIGFTDYHSHILPGVDDGVQTMDESLEILRLYEEQGIKSVWLTPHIMEDIPNTTAHLRDRFAELQAASQVAYNCTLQRKTCLTISLRNGWERMTCYL